MKISGWRLGLALLGVPASMVLAQRETVLKQIAVPHHYYFREMYLPQVTTGAGWAAWMPDGHELVYSMAGTLWRQPLGSGRAVQLTDGPGYDYQPDVSPDGRLVVYASYQGDAVQLRLLDLATGRSMALVDNRAVNVEPRWSPDGTRIAFVSTIYQGRWHVHLLDVKGGQAAGEPLRISPDLDSKLPRYYYGAYDHYLSPTWSPDGQELIVVSNAGRIWGTGGIWRMAVRPGLAPREIHYEETAWKARPDWARDGKRVVYSSFLGRSWNQLFLMTADGENPFQLTYGDFDNTNPRWSPGGTMIAYITNQGGNTGLRVLTIPSGEVAAVAPRERVWLTPHQRVIVRVTDPAGHTTPARVSVTGPDGRGWFPADAWAHADDGFDRSQRPFEFTYFHTAGTSTLELPAGRYVVETTKGYEFARRVDTITVAAAPVVQVLPLHRLIDLAGSGWWSGDLHIHMNYGGHYRNTPTHLRLQSEAEDLHVAENLVVNKETRIPDIAYFAGSGLDPASTATTLIRHDEEYHTSYWGHSGLLGLSRFFVMPAYAGFVATAAASLYPHNTRIFDLTHAQGGITGYVHAFESVPDFDRGDRTTHAFPIDAALGRLDYIEVVGFTDHLSTAEVWYRMLNTGVRLPTGAGTDAMANYASLRGPVGLGRVYVKSGRPDYRAWLAALKAGKTFATNGPLLGFTLGGREIGSAIDLPKGGALEAVITLRSIVPVDSLQVVSNGRVIHSVALAGDRTRADAKVSLPVGASAWFTVRAFARHSRHPVLDVYPFATTSPIYVTVGGMPIRSAADARYFIRWLDQLEPQVRNHEGWNSAVEKTAVLDDIGRARAFYEARAR